MVKHRWEIATHLDPMFQTRLPETANWPTEVDEQKIRVRHRCVCAQISKGGMDELSDPRVFLPLAFHVRWIV